MKGKRHNNRGKPCMYPFCESKARYRGYCESHYKKIYQREKMREYHKLYMREWRAKRKENKRVLS